MITGAGNMMMPSQAGADGSISDISDGAATLPHSGTGNYNR